MWQPKSSEFEEKAEIIAREYNENGLSIPEIGRLYRMSLPSVYRYLNYKGVVIRPRRRDEKGKFIPSR